MITILLADDHETVREGLRLLVDAQQDMKGLIKEGDDLAGDDYDDPGLRDAAIIGAAQRVEHYEIAAYGTAIAHARQVGQPGIARLLETTLDEEKTADSKLTSIAEQVVNPVAAGFSSIDRTTRTPL